MILTADTITDAQIHELRLDQVIDIFEFTYAVIYRVPKDRALCARIWNAREAGQDLADARAQGAVT